MATYWTDFGKKWLASMGMKPGSLDDAEFNDWKLDVDRAWNDMMGPAHRPPCPPGKHQAAKGERHCVWCGEAV